jgi:hypothetical protein
LYINVSCELSLTKNSKNENLPAEDMSSACRGAEEKSTSANESETLCYWAARILRTADPREKCSLTQVAAEKWKKGELQIGLGEPPETPERQETLNVLEPNKIKRGKGGTLVKGIFFLLNFESNTFTHSF